MTEHQIKTRKIVFNELSNNIQAEPLVTNANEYSDIALNKIAKTGLYDITITIYCPETAWYVYNNYTQTWHQNFSNVGGDHYPQKIKFDLIFHFLSPTACQSTNKDDVLDFLENYLNKGRTQTYLGDIVSGVYEILTYDTNNHIYSHSYNMVCGALWAPDFELTNPFVADGTTTCAALQSNLHSETVLTNSIYISSSRGAVVDYPLNLWLKKVPDGGMPHDFAPTRDNISSVKITQIPLFN